MADFHYAPIGMACAECSVIPSEVEESLLVSLTGNMNYQKGYRDFSVPDQETGLGETAFLQTDALQSK